MTDMLLVLLYLGCSVGGLTLVKTGAGANALDLTETFFALRLSYSALAGLILYIISFLLWMVIVSRFELSFIQPVTTGLSYILIIAVSVLILKESVSPIQWGGLLFILIGVILMNLGK